MTELSSEVVSPTPDSSLSTEHTPADLGDYQRQPETISQLSELRNSNGGTPAKSPKPTPDSGIHADITTSIEESGNTDTTCTSSIQHTTPSAIRLETKTPGSHGQLSGTSRMTGLARRPVPQRDNNHTSYISSSTSPEESREHIRSRPSLNSQQLRPPHPRSAWAGPFQSRATTSTEHEGMSTKTMFTQTERPNAQKYFVSTTPLPEPPELTATDITSSDDQSSTMGISNVRRPGRRDGHDPSSTTGHPVRRGVNLIGIYMYM